MIRFENLKYSHTDVFHTAEYIVKLVADFDAEEIEKAGLEVEDSYNLVIEIVFLEGKMYDPMIWNLEDNEFICATDEETDLIVNYYNNIKKGIDINE